MKDTIVKQLSKKEIVVAVIGLEDVCNNGYDVFVLNVTMYATNGDKREGSRYLHENELYYFVEGGYHCEALAKKYFPEFMPIYPLKGCDVFGFDDYPVLNGFYHLTNGKHDAVKEQLRITDKEVKQLVENRLLYYVQFLMELQATQYRVEVETAIKVIESQTGQEYVKTDKVSPRLYNDLHYKFLTKEKGWNVYKSEKKNIDKYPI